MIGECKALRASFLLGTASLMGLLGSMPLQAQSVASIFTTGTRYNLKGQTVGVISPDPDGAGTLKYAATRNWYNSAGQLTKVESGELSTWQSESIAPAAWTGFTVIRSTEYTYDAAYRKVSEQVRGSDGSPVSLIQYSYDALGRLECTAERLNVASYGSPPASACSIGPSGILGPDRITQNAYDAVGQLLQVRKAVGTPTEKADVTYSYTDNGKQEYIIDANGNRAKLEYDGFDRQVKWIFPSPTSPSGFNFSSQSSALATAGAANASDYEQYGYDANGNRTSFRKRDGATLTYQYDALNRVVVKVVPERGGLALTHTRDVYYGYDAQGRMTYARFDNATGEGVATAYDGFGRISSAALGMDGVIRTLGYAYDADGNRIRMTHPDGLNFWVCYDGLDRFDRAWWNGSVSCPTPGGVPGVSSATQFAAIAYNSAGLRSTINRASSYSDFSYNPASQLDHLTQRFANSSTNVTQDLAYNPASQITSLATGNTDFVWSGSANVSVSYTKNGLNQYTAINSYSYTYDANGNLTSDGATNFVYDVENRLVSASGAHNATLRYDPMGRLYEVVTSASTTRFLYDGDHLADEYSGTGVQLGRYFWGPGEDEPILWDQGSAMNCSGTKFLHGDHQGSIIAIADCSGNRLAVNKYDEYGIPASNQGRFGYTGQAWIDEIGLNYYKARMYSPTIGRFMQIDPIGYNDQFNLYAYVENDPVNETDSSGECPACVVGAIVGGAVEAYSQYHDTGRVGGSGAAWLKIGWAAALGATGAGAGELIAAKTASILGRAALNAGVGAATNATGAAINAKYDGRRISAGEVARAARIGAASGVLGSVTADRIRGGARVLAEQRGVNIATRTGRVATPVASGTRDRAVRTTSSLLGNAVQAVPPVMDTATKKSSCATPQCR